jgi:hypothetical protein
MHCKACDTLLSDNDLLHKDKETGEHLDLCSDCRIVSNNTLYDDLGVDTDKTNDFWGYLN